jgi:hypothetical protein
MEAVMLAKEVWDTLSRIDVSEHVEKKQNLSYLSWAWAWGTMMKHYPNLSYYFEDRTLDNGTMEVTVHVTIYQGEEQVTRHMWLPVMDYKNKAIPNPDSFSLNTSKMRCLTKCFALFGLGHYIYAGEDLPEASNDTIDGDQYMAIMSLIEKTNSDIAKFLKAFNIESVEAMPQKSFQKALTALQRKVSNEGK